MKTQQKSDALSKVEIMYEKQAASFGFKKFVIFKRNKKIVRKYLVNLTLAGKATNLLSTCFSLKMAERSKKREAKLRVKLQI